MPIGTPSLAESAKAVPTVSLTQAVHFPHAKGQDAVVGSGQYLREVAEKSGLTLTPVEDKKPIVIVQSRRFCENTSRTLHAGERKGTSSGAPVTERESHRRRGITEWGHIMRCTSRTCSSSTGQCPKAGGNLGTLPAAKTVAN